MEQQFILRLPEKLRDIDPKLAKIARISQKEVKFTYNGISYPGIICQLPTIVDSHKFIDNKLYKIADISTLVVIYSEKNIDIDKEIAKVECNGLTPPMAYIKNRRKKPDAISTEQLEKVEKKVAELLKEDAKAIKVEYFNTDKESSEDIDLIAAEIEGEIPSVSDKEPDVKKETIVKKEKKQPLIKVEIDQKPADVVPVISKVVETQNVKPPIEIVDLSPPTEILNTTPEMVQETVPSDSPDAPAVSSMASPEVSKHKDLVEIEDKIKEKQELLNKAVNPILKKRFELAIAELRAEYERKEKELNPN